jgi:serine/threonine-protein kinase RsbW
MAVAMIDRWIWLYDRVIASDTKAGREVLDELLEQLEAQHWQQREIFAIHLATEEALVNAICHGNNSDAQKNVHVVFRLASDRIRIEISDEGPGFNPAVLPDPTASDQLNMPCGRGVMLMRAFMSRVEFNAQGNTVIMEKDREKAGEQSHEGNE